MIHVPLSLAYSRNLALLQSPVNTTDQTSIKSPQAHYQHASLSQHSYKLSFFTGMCQRAVTPALMPVKCSSKMRRKR